MEEESTNIQDDPNKSIWITEENIEAIKLIESDQYATSANFETIDNVKELDKVTWKGRIVCLAFKPHLWVEPQLKYKIYNFMFYLGCVAKNSKKQVGGSKSRYLG
jgi:hypothetical protein